MRYDRYRYLWPPRPSRAIPPDLLINYERNGWWAQAKTNGTCLVLSISPDREIIPRTRHGCPPNRWLPGDGCRNLAATLPAPGWFVFVGELLHCRGVGIRDTVYLFDVLVDAGEYLVGATHAARQARLAEIIKLPQSPDTDTDWSHAEVYPGIWAARNHRYGFRELWEKPPGPYVEGLVMKDPRMPLRLCVGAAANTAGQVKSRYPTDQISF